MRGARQLLTLNGPSGPRRGEALQQLGIVEDGAVLIENGIIVGVGPSRRVENLSMAKGAAEISASGRVVMPGFVDSSTHLVTAPRGVVARSVRTEMHMLRLLRSTPARALQYQASKFMRFCVRHGTTTLEAKSGPLADETTQMKLLRLYGDIDLHPAHTVPTYNAGSATVDPAQIAGFTLTEWHTKQLLPRIAARKLAHFAEIEAGGPRFGFDDVRSFLAAASAERLKTKIQHVGGPIDATLQLAREGGAAGVEGVQGWGAMAAREIAALPCSVICAPFRMREPARDVRTLIDEGAAVALATSFHDEYQPIFSMQMVVSFACRELALTVEEAVSAATVNGAWAVGEGHRRGSLQFGKEADLLLLNVADYRDLTHYYGANLVHMTMRGGEIVFREGEMHWPSA